ncbi:MAG: DJ-1/PfpI family protein [Desulfobacterales bacterium]|nr:MAG: DJ-1/PfpI family protein [Desulfobacterales bacterium]
MKSCFKKSLVLFTFMGFLVLFCGLAQAGDYLEIARKTGITITEDADGVITWTGEFGGQNKPNGPLKGKKIGVLAASEFSDHQAYYFMSFIGEFGGELEFVLDDNHLWKETRPNVGAMLPHGMWGLNLDEPRVMGGSNKADKWVALSKADPLKYDAMLIIGGHSGDVMCADPMATEFLKKVADNGAVIAGIGAGIMPMIRIGIMNGKKCTGNATVDYMLKEIADFRSASVITDGKIITGRDTADSAAVLRALCQAFDANFVDEHKGILKGKTVMIMITEDWEDIEMSGPMIELMYRGANIVIGLFEPQMKARAALLGLDVRTGNFGCTVPIQEIPLSYYKIIKEEDLKMSDFDLFFIPGAFNPWQIAVKHRQFLRDAYAAGKYVAFICHGAIPIAAADLVRGKKVAGWMACYDSVTIMGGVHVTDAAAIIDGRLVSGQTPPQVPEFTDAMTAALLMDQ